MADISPLSKSEFWKKKIRKAVVSSDTNKDGHISREDFQIVLERYKKVESSKEEHLEKLSKRIFRLCDITGMKDATVKLSYEEFEQRWLANIVKYPEHNDLFRSMFDNLDINGDGVISFSEWETHYVAMGISPEHARPSFDAMDANSDGKVTLDEFVNYHHEFFYTSENKLNSAILYGPL